MEKFVHEIKIDVALLHQLRELPLPYQFAAVCRGEVEVGLLAWILLDRRFVRPRALISTVTAQLVLAMHSIEEEHWHEHDAAGNTAEGARDAIREITGLVVDWATSSLHRQADDVQDALKEASPDVPVGSAALAYMARHKQWRPVNELSRACIEVAFKHIGQSTGHCGQWRIDALMRAAISLAGIAGAGSWTTVDTGRLGLQQHPATNAAGLLAFIPEGRPGALLMNAIDAILSVLAKGGGSDAQRVFAEPLREALGEIPLLCKPAVLDLAGEMEVVHLSKVDERLFHMTVNTFGLDRVTWRRGIGSLANAERLCSMDRGWISALARADHLRVVLEAQEGGDTILRIAPCDESGKPIFIDSGRFWKKVYACRGLQNGLDELNWMRAEAGEMARACRISYRE